MIFFTLNIFIQLLIKFGLWHLLCFQFHQVFENNILIFQTRQLSKQHPCCWLAVFTPIYCSRPWSAEPTRNMPHWCVLWKTSLKIYKDIILNFRLNLVPRCRTKLRDCSNQSAKNVKAVTSSDKHLVYNVSNHMNRNPCTIIKIRKKCMQQRQPYHSFRLRGGILITMVKFLGSIPIKKILTCILSNTKSLFYYEKTITRGFINRVVHSNMFYWYMYICKMKFRNNMIYIS